MPSPLDTLLSGLIDYAGLFPPAGLPMHEAVVNYSRYRRSPDRDALGRFIVPAGRLDEFSAVSAPLLPLEGAPWRLSVLVGENQGGEVEAVRAFNDAQPGEGGAHADVLEGRAGAPDAVGPLARAAAGFTLFVEVPAGPEPMPFIAAIAREGVNAKIRTGGVTPEAIPAPAAVARFLSACISTGVPFKATAGLHHPIRGTYPLTYAPDSPTAVMHGYLNLFLAAALLAGGGTETEAVRLLEEQDPRTFRVGAAAVHWREHAFEGPALAALRSGLATGFGSCSFDEPLDDLRSAGFR